MALCQNVQTFCAAQVIYWTGMNGVDYVFNIFIADTALMENRLIWMAFTGLFRHFDPCILPVVLRCLLAHGQTSTESGRRSTRNERQNSLPEHQALVHRI